MNPPSQTLQLLWIATWYPTPEAPYNGDFIQRHAEAVSRLHKVTLIHVRRQPSLAPGDILRRTEQRGGLTEIIIGYGIRKRAWSVLEKMASDVVYQRVLRAAIEQYLEAEGKPHALHLHVNGRPAPALVRTARRHRLPLFLSEHWSAFLPQGRPFWRHLGRYQQLWIKRVWREAVAISAVSAYLARQIETFSGRSCAVIPNVVNERIYAFSPPAPGISLRLVHISGLDDNKNWRSILEGVALARTEGREVTLEVFGPHGPEHEAVSDALGLTHAVSFRGEAPPAQLAAALREAHGLVLLSRYETFGCVLIEAAASGRPVLVSPVPAFRDIVEEGRNGFVVSGYDGPALAAGIRQLMQEWPHLNLPAVAEETAARFGYAPVANAFDQWYRSALGGQAC